MSKAYSVSFESWDGPMTAVVWCKTRGQAKVQALGMDGFEDARFTELRAIRAPWADNFSKLSSDQMIVEELKQGWHWTFDYAFEPAREDDVALIEQVGGFSKFTDLIWKKQIVFNNELDRYVGVE